MATIKTTGLSRKTLVQNTNQKIRGSKAIEFAKKAGLKDFEDVKGAYLEFQDLIGVRAAYFDQFAFIQTDKNFSTSGTGLQANNRQEVDKQWLQSFYFPMPNPKENTNKDFFVQNYMFNEFADQLLDKHFIDESFAELDSSFDLLYANRFIFGVDRISTTMDGITSNLHYAGLKDLITKAKSDTAATDVDSLNVLASKPTRYFDLSGTSITDLNAFSQLNNLEYKLSQVQTFATFGSSTDTVWVNNGDSEIKYVCWNSFIEKVKAKNYQFYKELQRLFDQGKLIPLVESTLDVEKINRDDENNGSATPLAITPTSLGLAADEILLYDANSWVSYGYPVLEEGEEITMNNISQTHKKVSLCRVSDYLPTGAVAVVKAPSLITLEDIINP